MRGEDLNALGRIRSFSSTAAREREVQRQAISKSPKLSAVIWSSGEYLVLASSRPKACHSPSGTWASDSNPVVTAVTNATNRTIETSFRGCWPVCIYLLLAGRKTRTSRL